MSQYRSQIETDEGSNDAIWPENMLKYIQKFSVLQLNESENVELLTNDHQEMGMLIMEGTCDISIDGKEYKGLGSRKSIFDGLPSGGYIPSDSKVVITSYGVKLVLGLGHCSTKKDHVIVRPDDVKVIDAGKNNWYRNVRLIIPPNGPSENLIIGETINPPGNWSTTPPHKHDVEDLPNESMHEELYYFKFDKPQGYGIEKYYTKDRKIDELIELKDNSVTVIPQGYHQIVSAPDTLYYLFFLSGVGNDLVMSNDPEHDWVTSAEYDWNLK